VTGTRKPLGEPMAADDARHGTPAGYQAHMRRGPKPACEACTSANRIDKQLRLMNGGKRAQVRAETTRHVLHLITERYGGSS
jgi:hypothetical protein